MPSKCFTQIAIRNVVASDVTWGLTIVKGIGILPPLGGRATAIGVARESGVARPAIFRWFVNGTEAAKGPCVTEANDAILQRTFQSPFKAARTQT